MADLFTVASMELYMQITLRESKLWIIYIYFFLFLAALPTFAVIALYSAPYSPHKSQNTHTISMNQIYVSIY